jgi:hypothetical protein
MKKVTRMLAAGALAASAALPLTAGIAHAEDCAYQTCAKTPPEVLPQDVGRTQAVAPAPAPAAVEAQQSGSGSLPFTGTDVIELSLIGVGAVAAGTVLVRRGRRTA